jgi:hypothetical protein
VSFKCQWVCAGSCSSGLRTVTQSSITKYHKSLPHNLQVLLYPAKQSWMFVTRTIYVTLTTQITKQLSEPEYKQQQWQRMVVVHVLPLTLHICDELLNCSLALVGRDSRVHAYVLHHLEITSHWICQPCKVAELWNQAHHALHFLEHSNSTQNTGQ